MDANVGTSDNHARKCRWDEDFEEAISAMHAEDVKPVVEEVTMSNASIKERMEKLKAKSKNKLTRLRANLLFMFRSHPLGAIAMSKVTDPFARGDRILVQMNVFIVLLSMSVAFFYSKSVRCCEDVVAHYTCPEMKLAGDMSIDCMGCVP
jgi:hypothetical protein